MKRNDDQHLEYVFQQQDLKTFETLIKHVNPTANISSFGEKLLSNIKNEVRRLFNCKEISVETIAFAIPLNARLLGEIPLDLININITDECKTTYIQPKITYKKNDEMDWDIDSEVIKMLLRDIQYTILFYLTYQLQKNNNKINTEILLSEIEKYDIIACHIDDFHKVFSPEGNMKEFHQKLYKIGWTIYNFQNKTIIVFNENFPIFEICGINDKIITLEGGTLILPFISYDDTKETTINYTTHFEIK